MYPPALRGVYPPALRGMYPPALRGMYPPAQRLLRVDDDRGRVGARHLHRLRHLLPRGLCRPLPRDRRARARDVAAVPTLG
eukprot:6213067-Pleurochrysis_carterae.AAC.1